MSTPTFRVEFTATGPGYYTPQAWPTKDLGRPTDFTLASWVNHFEWSTQEGGVNTHLADGAEGIVILTATVIRQSTGEEVATYA